MLDAHASPTLAVILGASHFPDAPRLADGRAFYNSAADLREYLFDERGLAIPRRNLLWLFDDSRAPSDQVMEIARFLSRRSSELKSEGERAENLFIYYVGHGLFTRRDQMYSLAVRSTNEINEDASSMRSSDLASVIKEHAAFVRRYLVFDCCFSASIYQEFQGGPLDAVRVTIQHELPRRGTALLCSSSSQAVSLAPRGISHTMFSGALIKSLHDGHTGFGPQLSFNELADLVREHLRTDYPQDWVRPEVHSPDQVDGDIANIPIFPNLAYGTQPTTTNTTARLNVNFVEEKAIAEVVPPKRPDQVATHDTNANLVRAEGVPAEEQNAEIEVREQPRAIQITSPHAEEPRAQSRENDAGSTKVSRRFGMTGSALTVALILGALAVGVAVVTKLVRQGGAQDASDHKSDHIAAQGNPVPTIDFFRAESNSILQRETARLTWKVRDASAISITGGIGDVGAQTTTISSPPLKETTIFEMKATGNAGVATATTKVVVYRYGYVGGIVVDPPCYEFQFPPGADEIPRDSAEGLASYVRMLSAFRKQCRTDVLVKSQGRNAGLIVAERLVRLGIPDRLLFLSLDSSKRTINSRADTVYISVVDSCGIKDFMGLRSRELSKP